MSWCRPSIACALPPHILERISQHGTQQQKKVALRTLLQSERLRGQRDVISEAGMVTTTPAGERRRTVYDARHQSELPGKLVRGETDPPTGRPAVDEAFDGAGATYDMFQQLFGRNSLDDRGLRLDSTVHYSEGFDNAFWNGTQMVYGDGDENLPEDERIFNRFTTSVDIIGHELTHGVIQHEANLLYLHQPGALNEAFADIFGALVKQWQLNQKAHEADWLIGAQLFTKNINAKAIRSMKDPGTAYDDPLLGKDPQPGHMDKYDRMPLWQDNGGVHVNSGIPNRAFVVAAIEMGGFAWERAGRVWYYALRDRLRRTSNFYDCARRTYQVAGELFGEGSAEQKAVYTGWDEVGIDCKKFPLAALDIL